MELEGILSLQVLNICDEEPLNNGRILGHLGGSGGVAQVDIPHRFLDACRAVFDEHLALFPSRTSSAAMEQRFQQGVGSRCEAVADFPRMLSQ